MNDIVSTLKITYLFKWAKVISIIKPGKDGTDPAHYRPISLLSVVYELLDRLILQRILQHQSIKLISVNTAAALNK
jgi:hypothetical protein